MIRIESHKMVRVPEGEFLFGFDQQRIILPAFFIDIHPVTNEDYLSFVEETGHYVPFLDEEWAIANCWQDGHYPSGKGRHPVVLVNFEDASEYASWVGKRLPSDKEWEKASRGIDGRDYPWGEDFIRGNCNTRESGIGTTIKAGQYPNGVSPYSCLDMAGNVWEWTSSEESPDRLIIKGGSFTRNYLAAQCAYKSAVPISHKGIDIGFRCVRDV